MKEVVSPPYVKRILFILVLLIVIPLSASAFFAPSAELHLNTVVNPTSVFTLSEESPVTIIPGTTQTIQYHFRGNFPSNLEITSDNYGNSSFRLKHTELDAYIPYEITFDYGTGVLETVTEGVSKAMNGFNTSNENEPLGYDITSSLQIISANADEAADGTYTDTITFSIIAQ